MAKHGQYLNWKLVPVGNSKIPLIEEAVGAGKAITVPHAQAEIRLAELAVVTDEMGEAIRAMEELGDF